MSTAAIFNIQRFSLHDGPGIRTTVFLKGCPLRCDWCHNPESMDPRPEPLLRADRCLGCDLCAPACGQGIAGPLDRAAAPAPPDPRCVRCGDCAEACPADARQLVGRAYGVSELVAEVLRDGIYHGETGGGVTFSGGEPLTAGNAPFLLGCLDELRWYGVHTAIDTCGHVETGTLCTAADQAGLVLFDLKLMDDRDHRRHCGVGGGRIRANLEAVAARPVDLRVRVPLIPDLTDTDANLEAVAAFVAALPRPVPVDLLPFHALAGDKHRRLGRDWLLAGAKPQTPGQTRPHGGPDAGPRARSDQRRLTHERSRAAAAGAQPGRPALPLGGAGRAADGVLRAESRASIRCRCCGPWPSGTCASTRPIYIGDGRADRGRARTRAPWRCPPSPS